MTKIHSVQRAEERYYLDDFKPNKAIKEIMNDNCVLMENNLEKESNIFMIRYENKYIKVVTDLYVSHVKTVLPLKDYEFSFIDNLINKLNKFHPVYA